ncbi:MAG: alpha/beta fold hydrolase [Chloroflexi bacterium]|nr:MAG: alpha/beta fold hydrolase [Chloroflexota bacterium]
MNLEIITHHPDQPKHTTPLLFIHGAWHGAWCWEETFLPYFAKHGYTAIALSLRGHGNSPNNKSLRWTRISDYVEDVHQCITQLPQTPILIGHSMGGLVIQKYLETHEAPAAILLAAVPVHGVLPASLRKAFHHPIQFLQASATMRLYPLISTYDLAKEAFFSDNTPPELIHHIFGRLQDESFLAFMDMLFFSLPRPQKVNTPLLILGAEKDGIFKPEEIEKSARAFGTQAEIFPNMGHDMMLEPGWQQVADRILAWLDEKQP